MRLRGLAMKMVSEVSQLASIGRPAHNGLRILIYHSVGMETLVDPLGLNNIEIDRFRQHLDILEAANTVPLLPLQIPSDTQQNVISFDDGFADNLHIAAPMLVERGLPFTVFITSDFIRNPKKGFLTPGELKELADVPGATIGAHSKTHPHLTKCDDQQLKAELEDSKHYIEDIIGRAVTTMSYPHGDADMRVRDAVIAAGYETASCSNFNTNTTGRDQWMLNRCFILREDTPRVLRQKINGDWDWLRFRHSDPLQPGTA